METRPADVYDDEWRINALGRLFTRQGVMHMVLEVDPVRKQCRVSRRGSGTTEVVSMSFDEVAAGIRG